MATLRLGGLRPLLDDGGGHLPDPGRLLRTTHDYLLYGNLADVANHTISGSLCSLGTSGSFDWNTVPAGDLFFLLVGSDGAATESSWGIDSTGAERNGSLASGECSSSIKEPLNVCP